MFIYLLIVKEKESLRKRKSNWKKNCKKKYIISRRDRRELGVCGTPSISDRRARSRSSTWARPKVSATWTRTASIWTSSRRRRAPYRRNTPSSSTSTAASSSAALPTPSPATCWQPLAMSSSSPSTIALERWVKSNDHNQLYPKIYITVLRNYQ